MVIIELLLMAKNISPMQRKLHSKQIELLESLKAVSPQYTWKEYMIYYNWCYNGIKTIRMILSGQYADNTIVMQYTIEYR